MRRFVLFAIVFTLTGCALPQTSRCETANGSGKLASDGNVFFVWPLAAYPDEREIEIITNPNPPAVEGQPYTYVLDDFHGNDYIIEVCDDAASLVLKGVVLRHGLICTVLDGAHVIVWDDDTDGGCGALETSRYLQE